MSFLVSVSLLLFPFRKLALVDWLQWIKWTWVRIMTHWTQFSHTKYLPKTCFCLSSNTNISSLSVGVESFMASYHSICFHQSTRCNSFQTGLKGRGRETADHLRDRKWVALHITGTDCYTLSVAATEFYRVDSHQNDEISFMVDWRQSSPCLCSQRTWIDDRTWSRKPHH